MTDRQLLEAAAKAAGITFVWRGDVGPWIGEHYSGRLWNPLTDDGDEARLEAALDLDVVWLSDRVHVAPPVPSGDVWERFADHGGDKQAARRRAGVRAAAALGERGKT